MKRTTKILALALSLLMLTESLLACGKQGLDDITGSDGDSNSANSSYSDDFSDDGSGSSTNKNSSSGTNKGTQNEAESEMTEEERIAAQKKKEANDKLLAAFMPTYEALRAEIKAKKSGYDLGTEDKSIGTPNSAWNATLPTITESHPRLLLTSKTIPTIRKSLKEDTPTNKRYYELLDKDISTINNGKLEAPKENFDGRNGLHNYRKDYLEFIQII